MLVVLLHCSSVEDVTKKSSYGVSLCFLGCRLSECGVGARLCPEQRTLQSISRQERGVSSVQHHQGLDVVGARK